MDNEKAIQTRFIQNISETIREFHMLDKNDNVLLAVSGGPDSVALALAMLRLRKTHALTLGVAHLNHLLRGKASLADEAFVTAFARQFNLPLYCEQIDVSAYAKKHRLSIETAGRDVRYDFFDRLSNCHGYHKIATGHTKDDNAELVLMNLIRGSGPRGLSGIPPVRECRIIRPLINVSKGQILEFLAEQNQAFQVDDSNTDPVYLRNRIRSRLMPLLYSEYNPEIINALDRLSHILRQEEEVLENETQKQFNRCRMNPEETSSLSLSIPLMSALHPAILNRVIRQAVKKIKKNLNRISFGHIKDIIAFCRHASSGSSLDLPGKIRIYKHKEQLIIKKETIPLRELGKKEKQSRQKAKKKSSRES